ncbi:MAG: TrmH family RNA methyltransferase [Dermatophilaceae bacterium]
MASLARGSARERTGLFLAEGPQPVREAVRHRSSWVRDVYLTPVARDRHTDIVAGASGRASAEPRLHLVTDEVMRAMSTMRAPQGVLAVCRVPVLELAQALAGRPALACVLSHVRDPGNAGTVLRSADAAGADLVIVSVDSVDVWSPKVVRSSAGSLFHVPVVTGVPTALAVEALQAAGLMVLAADSHAPRLLGEVPLDRPHAWVLGNEAWGISPDVRDRCDHTVRVPIYGSAESLNLAMAATLCLYASAEGRRQRSC